MSSTGVPPRGRPWRAAAVAALLLGGEARAQDPGCPVPLDAAHVRVLVDAAHEALLDDDTAGHAALLGRFRAAVPCLSQLVPSDAWARLLYEWALVRHAAGERWEYHVTAALLADPGLDRALGADEVRTYLPPPIERPFTAPDEAPGRWFVDGREVTGRFALVGPHVLQVRGPDGRLVSLLVEDGVLPRAWWPDLDADEPLAATEPVDEPRGVVGGLIPGTASSLEPAPPPVDTLVLRAHVATGLIAAFGDRVEAGGFVEPATKLIVPLEAGVSLELPHGFVRVTGEFTPLVHGTWVYEADERVHGTPFGGGGAVAGGGRIRSGHVGALVGLRDPGRAVFSALGGVQIHRTGLRVEGRAGVHLGTTLRVEPAIAVLLAWAPAVWRR